MHQNVESCITENGGNPKKIKFLIIKYFKAKFELNSLNRLMEVGKVGIRFKE